MTWTSFHRRGDVLRDVIAAADQRRDGVLPRDVDGVAATFADDLDLLAALQLKWHTRLAGRIEREQMTQPMDLRASVVRAWHRTADELPLQSGLTKNGMSSAGASETRQLVIVMRSRAGCSALLFSRCGISRGLASKP